MITTKEISREQKNTKENQNISLLKKSTIQWKAVIEEMKDRKSYKTYKK
jgi:hypothetical protein